VENISFPEAVRSIATKLGIPLPKQQYSPGEAQEASLRAKLLDLHQSATDFFQQQLKTPAAAAAREYLNSRALTDEMAREFRVGYAPESGFVLRDRLKSEFDEATLKQSGLFSWKDEQGGVGAMYAKIRDRVMFPIANEQGKVIAFGGRTLATDKEKAGPKYLNSPETPIYSKGRVLYNLDKAKEAIRKLDYSIVVEGYLDCIRVYTAGMHNVIASSGTAFGEAQVRLLARYSKNIVVNFDPDTAGAAATERSLAMLVEEDFAIKVITLEPGLDPDLFIRKRGVDAYKEQVLNSRKYFHYLIDRAQQQFPGRSPEAKVKAVNHLLPHIHRVPSRIVRDELAAEVAQRLAIDSAVLRQELKAAATTRSQKVSEAGAAKQSVTPAEKILVRALLSPQLFAEAHDALSDENIHHGWSSEPLISVLLSAPEETRREPMSLELDNAQRALLANVLMEDDDELSAEEVRRAVVALRRPHLERRLKENEQQFDAAYKKLDFDRIRQLSREKESIKKQIMDSMKSIGEMSNSRES
jgi:DNA primase